MCRDLPAIASRVLLPHLPPSVSAAILRRVNGPEHVRDVRLSCPDPALDPCRGYRGGRGRIWGRLFIGWAVWPLLGDVPPARGPRSSWPATARLSCATWAEGGRSVPVRLDQVPESVQKAVLAAEDARFYGHHGIDLKSLAQAAIDNLRAGSVSVARAPSSSSS